MTNADKYLKDGVENIESLIKDFFHFVGCVEDSNRYNNIYQFFLKEVKPTLTEDEKVILRQLNKWFIVIGRTEHGCIMVQDKCQGNEKHFGVTFDLLFAELFKWIKPRRRI